MNFNDLPQEIRDAFFNGTKKRLTFRHGDYKFERDWLGAMRAMRERIENPPSEKIKAALEDLIAPDTVSGLLRPAIAAGEPCGKGQRPRHCRLYGISDLGFGQEDLTRSNLVPATKRSPALY